MKRVKHILGAMALLLSLLIMTTASVFASGIDWSSSTITVEGSGIAPEYAKTSAQARLLARRAAIADAQRNLAEAVSGVNVNGDTTVENLMVTSDVVKTRVSAIITGARVVEEQAMDGAYVVKMSMPIFGASNSLAGAVLQQPATRESFPSAVADVMASQPLSPADYGLSTTPAAPLGRNANSSAAAAPSGEAIGGYTGLIVDCRDLGLKPVMSPVIRNEQGTPIYGYKNLDYQKVIAKGMAAYVTNASQATRAGSNPLIVKAVAIENHNGDPVLSVADANRVLVENGATGFLDQTNVVFLR